MQAQDKFWERQLSPSNENNPMPNEVSAISIKCERKDDCANYVGECTIEDSSTCEDFEQLSEEQKLYNTLFSTITKLREYSSLHLKEENEQLKKEIDQLRKDYLQEARKETLLPFTLGQEIFIVEVNSSMPMCPECEGSKKVKRSLSPIEIEVQCTKCNGLGFINSRIYQPKKKRIEALGIYLSREKYTYNIEKEIYIYLEGINTEKQPKDIFLTSEECQAYINSLEKVIL